MFSHVSRVGGATLTSGFWREVLLLPVLLLLSLLGACGFWLEDLFSQVFPVPALLWGLWWGAVVPSSLPVCCCFQTIRFRAAWFFFIFCRFLLGGDLRSLDGDPQGRSPGVFVSYVAWVAGRFPRGRGIAVNRTRLPCNPPHVKCG